MSEPFLAELRLVSFSFAPRGWAQCNGQQLPIAQNQALFSLLGTTYGGNGTTTFALPDLRGRTGVHRSSSVVQGQQGGSEAVQLQLQHMPGHSHVALASDAAADVTSAAGATWARQDVPAYTMTPSTLMASAATTSVGGGQPHSNVQPSLALTWIIALQGFFPSRN